MTDFSRERGERLTRQGAEAALNHHSSDFMTSSLASKYSYNFSWLGRPIVQYPQDIVAVQEIVWEVKPDLIIETGIAHGGSLILSASLLAILDLSDAIDAGTIMNPSFSSRRVLGIDIDIRAHNREAIEAHPLSSRIQMIEGSSISPAVVSEVREIASNYERVLVLLDSNHTHDHVLAELEAYALCTSVGSYCVVFDTIIEDVPEELSAERPWGPGNNPKTAVRNFLKTRHEFEIAEDIQHKLLITVAPDGYLRRIL